jgi:AsmA protein
VQYTDEQTGQSYSAESIQLSTGPVHEGANIPLKASAFLSASQPNIKARTELRRTALRPQAQALQLRRHAPVRRNLGRAAGGKTMTFAAQGQVLVDLAANVASWTGLKVSANQLRALGELNVRDLDKTPQVSGGLSIAQFNLRTFLDSIGHPLPATADAAA